MIPFTRRAKAGVLFVKLERAALAQNAAVGQSCAVESPVFQSDHE